jgi:hypothetical protein
MHDQTAVRTGGLDDLPDRYPTVQFLVDSGYRGLANHHPDQVIAPPRKPSEDAPHPNGQHVSPHEGAAAGFSRVERDSDDLRV